MPLKITVSQASVLHPRSFNTRIRTLVKFEGTADRIETMAAFEGINMQNVINGDGSPVDATILHGKVIGLYFSAHWCGPCRGFTPKLAEKYKALVAAGHPFEIIFVSADQDEEAAMKYFAEMPWKMLAYHDREGESHLSQKYQVDGIPTLILLGKDGEVMTSHGRECVMDVTFDKWSTFEADRQAEEERQAKELEELKRSFNIYSFLSNCTVVDHEHNAVPAGTFDDHVVGIYFSAHWCPPCRGFTPLLSQKYKEIAEAGHRFKIVFVSSDRDKASAEEYFAEMPWLMLDFHDQMRKNQLSEVFDVSGIPTLVLLDKEGVITDEGRTAIMSVPFEKLRSFAEEKVREKERVDKICAGLPEEITVPQHSHPLKKLPTVYRGFYSCDVCGLAGEGWTYHCEECGFDAHPLCVCEDPDKI